jgi:hypothetical protein
MPKGSASDLGNGIIMIEAMFGTLIASLKTSINGDRDAIPALPAAPDHTA